MTKGRRTFERQLPADRRHALIEATLVCLARQGHEGLSIRRISEEAGVSVGLINHHFPSKTALVAEAYRMLHERLAQTLVDAVKAAPAAATARQRLDHYINAFFAAPNLNPDILHIWVVFWSLSRHTREIRDVREATYAASLDLIEGLIGDALREAERDPAAAHLAAIGLTAMLDGLWLESCLNPSTFTPTEGIALANAWINAVLGG
ncbi:MAG: TetR family transcriptional regulator C-terminal domain-containing protein [Hyphomicrobiaceae bacterium]